MRFTRDVANVTMDLNGVEPIEFNALGGADNDHGQRPDRHRRERRSRIDLARRGGGTGDGQADSVIVNGTAGNDTITRRSAPATVDRRSPACRRR